uniref:Uncharacterized protein n=1 Tax=Magallana gigas TaxID=29159 RepID=A0A8W8MFX6_MAGGI
MIWKRTLQLLFSFLSYIKATSPCPFPGFYGLLNCIKCGRCAGNDVVHVWEPIAVTSFVVTIACIVILVLLYRRKNNKTKPSYERNLVHIPEEETERYVKWNQLQENIRNISTASYLNKDRAEKNCSAIKAQRDLANFESESQDYTVPKFTREEGVPDDQSQTEPKPTDSEPHPYIYVISS